MTWDYEVSARQSRKKQTNVEPVGTGQSWARDNTTAKTSQCFQAKNGCLFLYGYIRCGYSIWTPRT